LRKSRRQFWGKLKEICPCEETALFDVGGILKVAVLTLGIEELKYSRYEGYDIL